MEHKFDGLREIVRDPKQFLKKANENPMDYFILGVFVYMLPWLFSINAVASAAASYVFSAASFYIIGKALGGKGSFFPILVCIGYASFPITLLIGVVSIVLFAIPKDVFAMAAAGNASQIALSIPLLAGLTAFVISFLFLFSWMFLINVLVCRQCHSMSPWKSIFVTLLSWIAPIIVAAAAGTIP